MGSMTATLCMHMPKANTCQRPTGQKLCFPYCWHVIGSCWLSGWGRSSWQGSSEPPQADLCCTLTVTHARQKTDPLEDPASPTMMNTGPCGEGWLIVLFLYPLRDRLLCRSAACCKQQRWFSAGQNFEIKEEIKQAAQIKPTNVRNQFAYIFGVDLWLLKISFKCFGKQLL